MHACESFPLAQSLLLTQFDATLGETLHMCDNPHRSHGSLAMIATQGVSPMRSIKRTIVLLAVLTLAGVLTTACNTMKGAGEDIEAAGEGIQDAAD